MVYPIMLDIKDRNCLVVGGGAVAVRKIRELLKSEAKIRVVSPTLSPALEEKLKEGNIEWVKDFYRDQYLDDALLCFACTDDVEVNRQIAEAAEARGILVNMAEGGSGDAVCGIRFTVPAARRKGDITVAVSCDENPAASRYMADFLESGIESWMEGYIHAVREIRAECRSRLKGAEDRQAFMRGLFDGEMTALAGENVEKARQEAAIRLEKLCRERSNQDE